MPGAANACAAKALMQVESLAACSLGEWDVIARQCRAAALARLAAQPEERGLLKRPGRPSRYLRPRACLGAGKTWPATEAVEIERH